MFVSTLWHSLTSPFSNLPREREPTDISNRMSNFEKSDAKLKSDVKDETSGVVTVNAAPSAGTAVASTKRAEGDQSTAPGQRGQGNGDTVSAIYRRKTSTHAAEERVRFF